MATRELREKVYALVANEAPGPRNTLLSGHTKLADMGFEPAHLGALAETINAEFGIALDQDDLAFAKTLTGVFIAVDALVTRRQEEEAHEQQERAARQAFEDTYSPAYLASLADRSGANQDLVELLWAGFANGFRAGREQQDS